MALPFVYIAGAGIIGALGLGGYSMGKEIGERTGKLMPWVAGSLMAYAAYRAVKK